MKRIDFQRNQYKCIANKIEARWKNYGINGGRLEDVKCKFGRGVIMAYGIKTWTPREAIEEKLTNGAGMAGTRWNERRTNGGRWNYTCDTNERMENMVTLSEGWNTEKERYVYGAKRQLSETHDHNSADERKSCTCRTT